MASVEAEPSVATLILPQPILFLPPTRPIKLQLVLPFAEEDQDPLELKLCNNGLWNLRASVQTGVSNWAAIAEACMQKQKQLHTREKKIIKKSKGGAIFSWGYNRISENFEEEEILAWNGWMLTWRHDSHMASLESGRNEEESSGTEFSIDVARVTSWIIVASRFKQLLACTLSLCICRIYDKSPYSIWILFLSNYRII